MRAILSFNLLRAVAISALVNAFSGGASNCMSLLLGVEYADNNSFVSFLNFFVGMHHQREVLAGSHMEQNSYR